MNPLIVRRISVWYVLYLQNEAELFSWKECDRHMNADTYIWYHTGYGVYTYVCMLTVRLFPKDHPIDYCVYYTVHTYSTYIRSPRSSLFFRLTGDCWLFNYHIYMTCIIAWMCECVYSVCMYVYHTEQYVRDVRIHVYCTRVPVYI